MRNLSTALVFGLCLATLLACSNARTAPAGRWEGTYEATDTMVVVRLEISPKGEIYLSAPDAMDIEGVAEDQKQAMRQRLADGLQASWSDAQPRQLDFDGRIFRKPGGVAPQMEWNPDSKQMTVIVYLGMHPAIRVPMRAVTNFSSNPWPG
jgi:hypothetical protein